jgi:hypothetical protein
MTFQSRLLVGAALAGSLFAANAQAATLVVDGGWTLFLFGGSGSNITDSGTGALSYDFLLGDTATLNVTDAFVVGDVFQIFDNGVSLFTTGPFNLAGGTTSDPDTAFAGSIYSHGSIVLGAGSHSITGIATSSPTGSGGAYIELVKGGAVPEPATWAMMIAGFGMVGYMARRRTARVAA